MILWRNQNRMVLSEKKLDALKTLKSIDIDPKIKALLRKEVKKWREFIKDERGDYPKSDDIGELIHHTYHTGEISFLEFFFNIKENIIKEDCKKFKIKKK